MTKRTLIIVGFFELILIGMAAPQSLSATYDLGISEGDEIVLEVTDYTEASSASYFKNSIYEDIDEVFPFFMEYLPYNDDIKYGDKKRITFDEISSKDDPTDLWEIKSTVYSWTDDEENLDDTGPTDDDTYEIYKSPTDIGFYYDDAEKANGVYDSDLIIIPTPVDDFLNSIDFSSANLTAEVEDTTLTLSANYHNFSALFMNIELYVEYDEDTGIITKLQVYNDPDEVFYEVSEASLETTEIPWTLIIIIGIVAIIGIITVIVLVKRKKKAKRAKLQTPSVPIATDITPQSQTAVSSSQQVPFLQPEVIYCSKCGTANKQDAAFCTKCGNKM